MAVSIRKLALSAVGLCVPCLTLGTEAAATGAQKLKGFGLAGSDAGSLPIGRVIGVFLLVAALAWGATWVLRRTGIRGVAPAGGGAGSIRALARQALPGGVTCHLVESQGRQVLISATRHGVSSVVLGESPSSGGPTP